jgi:hypothetical protein
VGLTVALPVHGRAHTRSRALACHRNAKSSPLCLSLYVSHPQGRGAAGLSAHGGGGRRQWHDQAHVRKVAAVMQPVPAVWAAPHQVRARFLPSHASFCSGPPRREAAGEPIRLGATSR